ncbi:hypothetical protein C6I20_08150 [Aeromicrobium sp. A1-2]|uniref:hypothetical protein n=1 Tax=Aeromicrobium sp. A1-2 TaxID=2107713 RepID=UPI000E4CE937|nr:hypothetical protein [Aeromicrobium sp. A1-2]AXT85159.1 hypothetical protein C6I20_08150 [Aeromicrobium sp. A1-2]
MRRILVAGLIAMVLLLGAVPTYAALTSPLTAEGPTGVEGTSASAVFNIGDRTVRQVRYVDRGTLVYTFTLANDGALPMTIDGLAPMSTKATLFTYKRLVDERDDSHFTIGAGDSAVVRLSVLMSACERLSARAGSFASEVRLRTSRLGVVDKDVTVVLPEEIHTGSAREAFCPRSSASSRPPG